MSKNEMELRLAQLEAENKRLKELAAKGGKKLEDKSQNCKMVVKGSILTITIDLTKNFGVSSSGKSEIVATTSGNMDLGAIDTGVTGIKLGINCYKPVK
jgi:hypothetical protein